MITNAGIYQHVKDAGVFGLALNHPDYRVVIKTKTVTQNTHRHYCQKTSRKRLKMYLEFVTDE